MVIMFKCGLFQETEFENISERREKNGHLKKEKKMKKKRLFYSIQNAYCIESIVIDEDDDDRTGININNRVKRANRSYAYDFLITQPPTMPSITIILHNAYVLVLFVCIS